MSRRALITFLILEIFAVINAAVTFHVVTSKLLAGTIAGTVFLIIGFAILRSGLRAPAGRKNLCFWFAGIQVFVFSAPMLVLRWINADKDFSKITYFGLPGPAFHHLSEAMYLVLICATAFDFFYSIAKGRAEMASGRSKLS